MGNGIIGVVRSPKPQNSLTQNFAWMITFERGTGNIPQKQSKTPVHGVRHFSP